MGLIQQMLDCQNIPNEAALITQSWGVDSWSCCQALLLTVTWTFWEPYTTQGPVSHSRLWEEAWDSMARLSDFARLPHERSAIWMSEWSWSDKTKLDIEHQDSSIPQASRFNKELQKEIRKTWAAVMRHDLIKFPVVRRSRGPSSWSSRSDCSLRKIRWIAAMDAKTG